MILSWLQDTTRYTYLLEMALEVHRGVILTGTSGVGKTRIVQRLMAKKAAAATMHNVVVNFSAQTSSAATQVLARCILLSGMF